MIIFTAIFLFYCTISVTSNDLEKEPIRVTGQGYHRKLEIELGTTEMKNALLKWEITPDFYVDVYELKRLGFEFRVDGGQTPFIEIEEPSHKSSFHSLSLNIHKANNSIPFHLRYQVISRWSFFDIFFGKSSFSEKRHFSDKRRCQLFGASKFSDG